MDEIYYKAVDLLQRLIATPSMSRDESAAADIVTRFLQDEHLTVSRIGNNVYVAPVDYDPGKPTLLLNSHIDTVKAADGWTRDPFTPVIDDEGRLYGLGSNDAGASVVSLIGAYLTLSEREQPYNLALLLSAEEEVSGKNGIESAIPLIGPVDFAVVGEPTGMRPAVAEKGLMVLDGEITGIAGHAARDEGVNAITRAIKLVEALNSLTFDNVSHTLGPVKISVTQIESGKQHNVVPDSCRIVVDVRTTDAYTNLETLALIRAAAAESLSDCHPELQWSLTPRSTRLNPSGVPLSHPVVSRAAMLGLEPFGSPTLSDQALMPWPSVKMGPGDSARSHTADEYIRLDEIREAIEYYVRILDGVKIDN